MHRKDKKILNFFFPFFFIFLLIIGYYIINSFHEHFIDYFSESSAHYFYSALFQANAAIISILGIFFIFRLQNYQSNIDIIKNGLIADGGRTCYPTEIIDWDNYSIQEKEELIEEQKTNKNGTNNAAIFSRLSAWTKKERKLLELMKSIKTPIIYISAVMLIQLFCLFSANHIHTTKPDIEFYIMYTVLILESSILTMIVSTIIGNIDQEDKIAKKSQ